MSLIICPKHGETGFCLRFSKQIIDAFKSDSPLSNEDVFLFNIQLIDNEDGEELYTETYILMISEFDQMGLPSVVRVDNEEEYDKYKNMLPDLGGICSECFSEYKERHLTNLLDFN